MGFDITLVTDFTPAVTLRRRSDGRFWNVSGANANTYTASQPTYANAKNGGSPGTGLAVGSYTFGFSNSGMSEGWHDVFVHDDGASGALMGVMEVYLKETSQVVVPAAIYHAMIDFAVDSANSQDEYTVSWFRDGVPLTSGITSPTIQVIKRADGSNLISSTSMTQVGSTGSYKKDEATNRLGTGEAAVVVVSATIDGASRAFRDLVSRDD